MNENIQSVFEYHDLIEAIVAAAEMRDPHTAYHSERVSNMTQELCRCLKLPEDETQLYHLAADLHDIGKIGIRDAVLLKDGPLDDAEWREMQSHTLIGSYILSKVERFDRIAYIVRHHHERWDGRGYPDGLSCAGIPLGARIIAVCDSIDAMLSDRSYRRALPQEVCRAEIAKNSGKMYDAYIAELALQNWDDLMDKRRLPPHSPKRPLAAGL